MRILSRVALLVALTGGTIAILIMGGPSWPRTFVGPSVVRAEQEPCSLASLHGTYAIQAHGTIVGQLPAPFPPAPFPFAEAGIVTFNSAGQHSGKTTANLGGVDLQATFTGNYTVNSDCTGTITAQSSAGFVLHDAIVVMDGGGKTVDAQTDPFAVATRTLERIED